jgi:hypothetical protein
METKKEYFDHCSWKTLYAPSLQETCEFLKDVNGPVQSGEALSPSGADISDIPSKITSAKHKNQNNYLGISLVDFEGYLALDSLFDSKQAITNQLIRHMSSIGKDRDRAKKDNLYQIESDILKCHNQLLELGGFYLGQCRAADQRKLSIEQRLFDLYREKRAEKVSNWRDQLWLQRDLIVALKEYLNIQRRKDLVNEIMEGNYSTSQDQY